MKREGVELSGAFTATVNADLRVGAVEETITVSGETPIVDIQSTTRQQVLDHAVIDAVPTGRLVQNLGVLLPGVSVSGGLTLNGVGTQDVGGSSGNAVSQLASHGGRGLDQRTTMNGLSLMLSAGVNNTPYVPNMGSTQEVTIDTSGVSAEAAEGGVRVNVIPKEGGNTFRGLMFASFANESMQSSNFTDDLKARGFTTPNALKKVADVNPAFGGPIRKDKLWFYASHRLQIAQNWVGGMFFDTTYNDPNVWTLNQDPNHRVSNDGMWNEGNVRLTWQATQKNKFGFSFAKEHMCTCPSAIRATTSPGFDNHWGWPHHMMTTEWTSPLTPRLLLEAGAFHQYHRWGWFPYAGTDPDIIGVLEQSSQINYKLRPAGFADRWQHDWRYRAAASYITGAHAFKVGFNNGQGDIDALLFLNGQPESLLSIQQRRAESDHRLCDAVPRWLEPGPRSRHLCPGPMDGRPSHGHGRSEVRLVQEQFSGGDVRAHTVRAHPQLHAAARRSTPTGRTSRLGWASRTTSSGPGRPRSKSV